MKNVCAVGGLILCALSASAAARAPGDFATSWAACDSGRGNARYAEAVDACWSAYEAAMAKRDYPAALAAANRGCEKYGRADYCTFKSQLPAPVARGGVVRVGDEQAQLGRSVQRAALFVHPADVEDGERGYFMRGGAAPRR